MKNLLFCIIFIYIANNWTFASFFESLVRKKKPKKDITDKELLNKIYKKTNLKLNKIYLLESTRFWGAMAGPPTKPYMVITTMALKYMNKEELEWLVLHEAGHHKIFFGLSILLEQLIAIIIGLLVINIFHLSLIFALLLGLLLAIVQIQVARFNEISANKYALRRMDNPKTAVSVAEVAKNKYWPNGNTKRSLKSQLFDVWGYDIYQRLVKDAEKEIERRKSQAK